METASETSSRCGTLPGSKNDARDRVNANSRPRCILSLHSNCWAEIATLAESELAQKKRFPDPGREYSDALDREAAAIVVGKDGTAACSSQELREYFSGRSEERRVGKECRFRGETSA